MTHAEGGAVRAAGESERGRADDGEKAWNRLRLLSSLCQTEKRCTLALWIEDTRLRTTHRIMGDFCLPVSLFNTSIAAVL